MSDPVTVSNQDGGVRTFTTPELDEILRKHKLWLEGAEGGERANLTYADLTNANLSGVDLTNADLTNANLIGANLTYADLTYAKLSGAVMPGFPHALPASLDEAAERTAVWLEEGRWLQSCWIQTPTGAYAGDCRACLHGAARYIGGPQFGPALSDKLCEAGYTVAWNDAPGRTVAEVAAACREVKEVAR